MLKYLENVLQKTPKSLVTSAPFPFDDQIFKVIPECEKKYLPKQKSRVLHHTVVQLIFMLSRSRCDIQTAVALLATHSKHHRKDDWAKIVRVLKYLKVKIGITMTLCVDNMYISKWLVHASDAVHEVCKVHTGAMMCIGKCTIIILARKQRIQY